MERNEHISAALDGEIDDAAWKTLAQDWDEDDQANLALYGAVGDVLRASSLAAFHNRDALDRIQAAIAAEPTVLAPTLPKPQSAWPTRLAKPLRYAERIALCGFAVLALALGLHRAVPVQMSDIQMVKSNPSFQISEEELAAWNELLLAHQLHSPRGAALLGTVAQVQPGAALQAVPQRVNVSNQEPAEWMNVWEPDPSLDAPIHFNYVSAIH